MFVTLNHWLADRLIVMLRVIVVKPTKQLINWKSPLIILGIMHYTPKMECQVYNGIVCWHHLSSIAGKPTSGFSTRSAKNRAVQSHKMARGTKFWI